MSWRGRPAVFSLLLLLPFSFSFMTGKGGLANGLVGVSQSLSWRSEVCCLNWLACSKDAALLALWVSRIVDISPTVPSYRIYRPLFALLRPDMLALDDRCLLVLVRTVASEAKRKMAPCPPAPNGPVQISSHLTFTSPRLDRRTRDCLPACPRRPFALPGFTMG
ncbi:hypothetical protein B0T22DRAFT_81365 [Podospora appendiculata]|uniref:Secreted protein n=1 Tax=Podospora appendiculata TaxID=314037 RepID=A0AAE0XK57_9PEZI|nr:hypothetical protein B0T22DRAFT_81365 [Podospora appendiculata]